MNRYKAADIAFVGTTWFTEGGDWRSAYLYARKAQSAGRNVLIVNPLGKRGIRQTLATWAVCRRIVVNALTAFDSWVVFAMCLCRSDVRIYLHETQHALNGYQTAHPLKYRLLAYILSRNPLLCVSAGAEALYKSRFGANNTRVVYEFPGSDGEVRLDPNRVHILNVGSLNERKGVELFGQVADLAKERHPDWQFHWVGGLATLTRLYQSPAVKWHGFMWSPSDLAKQCRLFFLSSVDDPCPLSALEALQAGLACVAYKDTGTAEIIGCLKGSGVFQSYCAEAAIQQIEKALQVEVDPEAQKSKLARLVGSAAFNEAIDASFRQ